MKKITYISAAACIVLFMGLQSCVSKLDVTNPNRFTDDDIYKYIDENPDGEEKVLTGLVGGLPGYINVYNADMNGGYSNSLAYESSFEFKRFMQSGDAIEGDISHNGTFSEWYQNTSTNTYWYTDQTVNCYGYYLGPVHKYGPAQKALDFLTADKVANSASMKASRAQALAMKAICYMMLMERWTDLQDVTSTTEQGWPIYDKYDYNSPQEPLSVAGTWAWIKDAFDEAATLGVNCGYTIGKESSQIYDIDLAVIQYYRCRAALDRKDWATAIEAGNDVLSHYPSFIKAGDYGMKASLLPAVNKRLNISEQHPYGTAWGGTDFNAEKNAFFNLEINPEAIFGGARGSSNIFWTLDGLNALKNGPSGYYQIDENLYKAMSDNDCRKACILPSDFDGFYVYTNNGADTTWYSYTMPKYTSFKWAASSAIGYGNHTNQSTISDNIYLRSSAVLLMTAEAYAQSGQDAQAIALLDKLLAARTIDGAATMTCANTMPGMSALDMVKLQWRLEMWGEGDWAFFNQKRWGQQFERGANHWSKTQIQQFTWKIPQQERQGNPYWDTNK
jgi:hypothetical protein